MFVTVPTRVHEDGFGRPAGTNAVVVGDGDGVELPALQVGHPAAGIGGAAAQQSLLFIHDGGRVGVHVRRAHP